MKTSIVDSIIQNHSVKILHRGSRDYFIIPLLVQIFFLLKVFSFLQFHVIIPYIHGRPPNWISETVEWFFLIKSQSLTPLEVALLFPLHFKFFKIPCMPKREMDAYLTWTGWAVASDSSSEPSLRRRLLPTVRRNRREKDGGSFVLFILGNCNS